jgi:uncharacterized damage-inducible protein DinB
MDPHGRIDPRVDADEREMLGAYLDYHRATLAWKVRGLGEDDARRPMVPSGTNLLGLVKHLIDVEKGWFQDRFAGRDVSYTSSEADPDADFRPTPDETIESLLAEYEAECATSRRILAGADSLDAVAARPRRDGTKPTMRWIMLHMLEETARHNGHADILREQIDGETGE